MKQKKIPLASLLLFSFLSCTVERSHRTVYASQPANIPYFKQKGDTKATGYYYGDGGSGSNEGFSVQGAYAISDRWLIMAAYNYKTDVQTSYYDSLNYQRSSWLGPIVEANIFDSSVIKYKRNFFEIGAGYVIPLNEKKTITYNLYPGVAFGKFTMDDKGLDSIGNQYARYYSNNITKWYIQGGFNFMPSALFNFSVGGKFSWLHFGSGSSSYSNEELDYFYLNDIRDKTFLIWEPYFNMQVSVPELNWIKIDGQLSFASQFNTAENIQYPKTRVFAGSIGLTFDLREGLIKKQKH